MKTPLRNALHPPEVTISLCCSSLISVFSKFSIDRFSMSHTRLRTHHQRHLGVVEISLFARKSKVGKQIGPGRKSSPWIGIGSTFVWQFPSKAVEALSEITFTGFGKNLGAIGSSDDASVSEKTRSMELERHRFRPRRVHPDPFGRIHNFNHDLIFHLAVQP